MPNLTDHQRLTHAEQAIRELVDFIHLDSDSPQTPIWYVHTEAAQHAVEAATEDEDYSDIFPCGSCDQCGSRVDVNDDCENDPSHETGVFNTVVYITGYKAAAVANVIITGAGFKAVLPQMVYGYMAKGRIPYVVLKGKKLVHEDVITDWANGYVQRKMNAMADAITDK